MNGKKTYHSIDLNLTHDEFGIEDGISIMKGDVSST